MWAAYIHETKGEQVIEYPFGFITYRAYPDLGTIHVGEVYVVPEERKHGYASKLMDQVGEIGKSCGCTMITTFVCVNNQMKETSLLASLKYGMRIVSMDELKITLAREL